jgi:endonuclease/exonuclease/phosphatase family metal-dependent hydrolase
MIMRKYVTSLLLCLAPWLTATALHAESTNTIRVMTYNIHHAEGLDGKIDLQRIADLIKQERADIVALQEVDRGMERTAKRDLPAEFAKLTGMSCVPACPASSATTGRFRAANTVSPFSPAFPLSSANIPSSSASVTMNNAAFFKRTSRLATAKSFS